MYPRRIDTNLLSNKSQAYETLYKQEYFVNMVPVTKEFRDKLKGNIPNYDQDQPSGMVTIRKMDRNHYKIIIEASGLPPNSVFSFENVIKMTPYTTKPLITTGFNGFVSDYRGVAMKVTNTKIKPGLILLLNYHTGNGITIEDGSPSIIYSAILGGVLPQELN